MSESKLLNSKQFAELCDVSASTIKNWVDSGKIIPSSSVNGKHYFLPEQAVDAYLVGVKSSVNPSFLGLIFNNDEDIIEQDETSFISAIKASYPEARLISSLKGSLKSMLESDEKPLSEDQQTVLNAAIVESFITSARSMIGELIKSIYLSDSRTWVYPFSFFIDVLSYSSSIDEALLKRYRENQFTTKITTVYGMRAEYQKLINALAVKHGLLGCFTNIAKTVKDENGVESCVDYPLADTLFSSSSLLKDILGLYTDEELSSKGFVKTTILFDNRSSVANALKKEKLKEKNTHLTKVGLRTIYMKGYYSLVEGSNSLPSDEVSACVSKLTSGDYRFVYVSGEEFMPDAIRIVLKSLLDSGAIVKIN